MFGLGISFRPYTGKIFPVCNSTGLDKDTASRSERRIMTARQIIEARLGRPLGPLATMLRDLRRALYLLALQLVKGAT